MNQPEFDCESERQKIRAIYNTGECKQAMEMAREFARKSPDSLEMRFLAATLAGDLSYDETRDPLERAELLTHARQEISLLYHDKARHRMSARQENGLANEYFRFFKLHMEQYAHGLKVMAHGDQRGSYSVCVGASSESVRVLLEEQDVECAQVWARRALVAFDDFQVLDPTWYNINHFGAQAKAVLGDFEGAEATYSEMFAKQGKPVCAAHTQAFLQQLELIKVALEVGAPKHTAVTARHKEKQE